MITRSVTSRFCVSRILSVSAGEPDVPDGEPTIERFLIDTPLSVDAPAAGSTTNTGLAPSAAVASTRESVPAWTVPKGHPSTSKFNTLDRCTLTGKSMTIGLETLQVPGSTVILMSE